MLNIRGARVRLVSAYIVICPVMLNITGARALLPSAYIAFGVRTLPLTKKFLTMKVFFFVLLFTFSPFGGLRGKVSVLVVAVTCFYCFVCPSPVSVDLPSSVSAVAS